MEDDSNHLDSAWLVAGILGTKFSILKRTTDFMAEVKSVVLGLRLDLKHRAGARSLDFGKEGLPGVSG